MVRCPECGMEVKNAKFCSNCGANLPDVSNPNLVRTTKFCQNCGSQVDSSVVICPECGFQFANAGQPQTKFCQSCGQEININAEICPHCGVRVAGIAKTQEKSVAVAVILSLVFPGLGQFYLGLSTKGITFVVAYIISLVLMFILIGFVLIFVVVIWALIDSIKSAEAINRGEYVEDKLF